MNTESVAGWLEAIGVPPEVISIGSEADNAWCVLRTEEVVPAPPRTAEPAVPAPPRTAEPAVPAPPRTAEPAGLAPPRTAEPAGLAAAGEPAPDAAPPDAPAEESPKAEVAGEPLDGDGEHVIVAWEVFWREQGNRYDWARFTNEQVACHYLFGRLAWSQVARGAVGLLPEKPPAPSPVDQSVPAAVPPSAGHLAPGRGFTTGA